MRLQHEEYKHFRIAVFFSLVLLFVLGVFVAIYGKNKSFLMINGRYSPEADYFFNYVTLLGEWILWVPIFLYALFIKRDFFRIINDNRSAVVKAVLVCPDGKLLT